MRRPRSGRARAGSARRSRRAAGPGRRVRWRSGRGAPPLGSGARGDSVASGRDRGGAGTRAVCPAEQRGARGGGEPAGDPSAPPAVPRAPAPVVGRGRRAAVAGVAPRPPHSVPPALGGDGAVDAAGSLRGRFLRPSSPHPATLGFVRLLTLLRPAVPAARPLRDETSLLTLKLREKHLAR